MKGWNLQIKIKNYFFYDSDDETGDCALLSINNINITKLFGHTYHIGILPKEHNIVKVSLMASDGSIYTFQDMAIMDFQLVMDRGQHNHDDHDHGNHLHVKYLTTVPFGISFKSEKDLTYTFQATSDLKNWSNVQEVIGTGDEIKITDWREAIGDMDIVTLHVPLTDETKYMIDDNVIKNMKTGAILVNAARGALVDSFALATALEEGKVFHLLDIES